MNSLGLSYASSSDEEEDTSSTSPVPLLVAAVVVPQQRAIKTGIEIEGLPSEPPGAVDPEVQARIARFLELQRRDGKSTGSIEGMQSFQENLQTKKEVANPYILKKVVEYFAIDELHTNFASEVFDPYGLPLNEYTESISLEQKKRQEEKLQQQQQRSQIAFTHHTRSTEYS